MNDKIVTIPGEDAQGEPLAVASMKVATDNINNNFNYLHNYSNFDAYLDANNGVYAANDVYATGVVTESGTTVYCTLPLPFYVPPHDQGSTTLGTQPGYYCLDVPSSSTDIDKFSMIHIRGYGTNPAKTQTGGYLGEGSLISAWSGSNTNMVLLGGQQSDVPTDYATVWTNQSAYRYVLVADSGVLRIRLRMLATQTNRTADMSVMSNFRQYWLTESGNVTSYAESNRGVAMNNLPVGLYIRKLRIRKTSQS